MTGSIITSSHPYPNILYSPLVPSPNRYIPKMDVLTYISCMDTSYVRKIPPPKIAKNKVFSATLSFRYLKILEKPRLFYEKKTMGYADFSSTMASLILSRTSNLRSIIEKHNRRWPLAMRTTKLKVWINCGCDDVKLVRTTDVESMAQLQMDDVKLVWIYTKSICISVYMCGYIYIYLYT